MNPLELLSPDEIGKVALAVDHLAKLPPAERSAYFQALRSNGTATRLTPIPPVEPDAKPPPRPHVRSLDLSAVRMEHVRWLWDKRIPREEVTIIQGDPGLGKGHIAADLAARFTTGRPMPDDTSVTQPTGRVLWLTTEDDSERVLKPRLVAAGADVQLVSRIVDDVSFPSGLDALRQLLSEQNAADPAHPVGMVVVDPLSEFTD